MKINQKTELITEYVRRQVGEEPYIRFGTQNGTPLATDTVDLILYHHDVLSENDEASTDAEWELISMHAIPKGVNKLPLGPITMMRNQLRLPGGTAANNPSDFGSAT